MKNVIIINDLGFFVSNFFISDNEDLSSDMISVLCPHGFYSPRWNGSSWVEGLESSALSLVLNKSASSSLDIERDKELKGFVIDNIFYNENIIYSMSVAYNIALDTDSIEWIGYDNQLLTFSKSDFGNLIKLGSQRVKEIYFKYRQLKDAL